MKQLQVLEQNNMRVLTTSQLAEAFGTDARIISNNFNRNKDRYTEGKHFFALTGEQKRQFFNNHQIDDGSKNAAVAYLWTEKGAWMHAKSLNTDKAWDAYEMLVDDYYRVIDQAKPTQAPTLSDALMHMAQAARLAETAIQEVAATKEIVEEQGMHLQRLDHELTNVLTIDHGRQRKVQKSIANRVYTLAPGSENAKVRDRFFRELHREIKDRFGVTSYKDIKHKDFEAAVAYIAAWVPRQV